MWILFFRSLISQKSHGGLTYPSDDVIKIWHMSERYIGMYKNDLYKRNFILMLTNKIISECLICKLFEHLEHHVLESAANHICFN